MNRYDETLDPFADGTYNPVQTITGQGYVFRAKRWNDGSLTGAVRVSGRDIEMSARECAEFDAAPTEEARILQLKNLVVADERRRAEALAAKQRGVAR